MDQELYHYGVKGMKWGVRRDPSKAYVKASKKRANLEKKYAKTTKKLYKASSKLATAQRRYSGWGLTSNQTLLKRTKQVARYGRRQEKLERKLNKWMDAMSETFDKKTIKQVSPEARKRGEDYVNRVLKRYSK